MYDLGTHIIDQVVSLFGKPEKVTGFVENLRGLGDPSVDDSVRIYSSSSITCDKQFSDNKYSSRSSSVMPSRLHKKYPLTIILRSHILSARAPQLRFVARGTKGTFIKYGLDCQEDQLKVMPDPKGIFRDDYGKEEQSIWGEVQVLREEGNVETRS